MVKQFLPYFFAFFTITTSSAQIALLNDSPEHIDFQILQTDPSQTSSEFTGSLFEVLDETFDSIVALSPINGFNAALLTPDGEVWKRSAGLAQEIPNPVPVTTEHLMGMGSISKSFVSATLLLMMEDGLLSLDDSIGMYLDPYPNVPDEATIRQLLSHRTGINDYLNENPASINDWLTYPDSIWVTDTILHNYVLEPNFPVGAEWSYSNTNYLLAGRIIENITGQPWYEVVRERIIDPLGLSHTFTYPFESPGGQQLSHCWANLDGNGFIDLQGNGFPIEGLFSIGGSAGCLITTSEDLVHFSEQLHGGYLLHPATLAEMQTDYLNSSDGNQYGLGVSSFSSTSFGINLENWGHNGSLIYQSFALYFPEENISLAVQQNDVRVGISYKDLYEVFLSLLNAYLDYSPPTAIGEISLDEELNVYPNPATDGFILELPEIERISYPFPCQLTDANGRILRSFELQQRKTEIQLNGLTDGIYFLRIGMFFEKIIID